MAKPKMQRAPGKGGFKRTQITLWLSVAFVAIVIMSLPTVLIITFGLLPTFVAYIIDRTKGKPAAYCVGGINLCGVFPYLLQLWTGNNTMDDAVMIMTDVFALVIMYGAAAFGWMVYQTMPSVVTTFMTVIAQHRVSNLRAQQRDLIEEWGKDVSMPQEILNLGEGMELSEDDEAGKDAKPGSGETETDAKKPDSGPPAMPSMGQNGAAPVTGEAP